MSKKMDEARKEERRIVRRKKQIDALWQKAFQHKVEDRGDGNYRVTSGDSGIIYDVILRGDHCVCNCSNGLHKRRAGCSHVLAAGRVHADKNGYQPIWPAHSSYRWQDDQEYYAGVYLFGDDIILLLGHKPEPAGSIDDINEMLFQ